MTSEFKVKDDYCIVFILQEPHGIQKYRILSSHVQRFH